MPIPEVDYTWTFTSTGTSTARLDGRGVREWTFHCETPAGSTAHFELVAFRDSTTAVGVVQGSSQTLTSSAGAGVVLGLTGPLAMVAPRCISLTSTGTFLVRAVGN